MPLELSGRFSMYYSLEYIIITLRTVVLSYVVNVVLLTCQESSKGLCYFNTEKEELIPFPGPSPNQWHSQISVITGALVGVVTCYHKVNFDPGFETA